MQILQKCTVNSGSLTTVQCLFLQFLLFLLTFINGYFYKTANILYTTMLLFFFFIEVLFGDIFISVVIRAIGCGEKAATWKGGQGGR